MKNLSSTPNGHSFVYQQLPEELCKSWDIQTPNAVEGTSATVAFDIPPITKPTASTSSTSSSSEAGSSSESEDSEDEIINFRPTNQKPTFKFEPSTLGASLPSFLAELKSSNDVLAAGVPNDQKFELSDSDSEEEHIEMNLGLGVLEDTSARADTPVSISKIDESSSDDGDDVKPFTSLDDGADEDSPAKILKLLHTRKTQDTVEQSSSTSSYTKIPPDDSAKDPVKVTLKFTQQVGTTDDPNLAQNMSTHHKLSNGRSVNGRSLQIVLKRPSKTTTIMADDSLLSATVRGVPTTRSSHCDTSLSKTGNREMTNFVRGILTALETGSLGRFEVSTGSEIE